MERDFGRNEKEMQNMNCSASVKKKNKIPIRHRRMMLKEKNKKKKKKSFFSFFLKEFLFKQKIETNIGFCFCSENIKLAESDLETSILSFQMHILKMEIKKKNEFKKVI